MSAPSGTYANLDELVAATSGIDSSSGFALTDPTRLVTFVSQDVQPPSQLYVTVDDALQLNLWTDLGAATLSIRVRILKPDGTISVARYAAKSTVIQLRQTFTVQLSEGFLLSASVGFDSGGSLRGRCFVQLGLQWGGTANPFMNSVLVSDYLVSNAVLSWPGAFQRAALEGPGGLIVSAQANPAVGADFVLNPGTNTQWRVRSLRAQLVTDATAGNRQVAIQLGGPSGVSYVAQAASTQAPSTTVNYSFAPGVPSLAAIGGEVLVPLPVDTQIQGASTIQTSTTGKGAGDQWQSIVIDFEEWIISQ